MKTPFSYNSQAKTANTLTPQRDTCDQKRDQEQDQERDQGQRRPRGQKQGQEQDIDEKTQSK